MFSQTHVSKQYTLLSKLRYLEIASIYILVQLNQLAPVINNTHTFINFNCLKKELITLYILTLTKINLTDSMQNTSILFFLITVNL